MKELSVEKQIYLCKYHDVDGGTASYLGITNKQANEILTKLKNNGIYSQYRNLEEDDYHAIIKDEKRKDKYTKILDKYAIDPLKKGYDRLKEILRIIDKKNYMNAEEVNISFALKSIANKEKVRDYIISNDCNRAIAAAYKKNNKLFELNDYEKSPTIREFTIKELNIPNVESELEKNVQENLEQKENIEENIQENNTLEAGEIIMNESRKDNEQVNGYIDLTVPEYKEKEFELYKCAYWYMKGYIDGLKGVEPKEFKV